MRADFEARVLRLLALVGVVLLPFGLVGCGEKEKEKEPEDPYGVEDELVRLSAYQELNYPDATLLGDGAFFKVLKEGTGKGYSGKGWLLFDYETTNLDGQLLGTSVAKVARQYGYYQRGKHYVPVYRAFSEELYGEAFYNTLYGAKEKAEILMGIPSFVPVPNGLWRGIPYNSSLCTLTLLEWVEDPAGREQKLLEEFIKKGKTDWGAKTAEGVYRHVIREGTGKEVRSKGTVWLRYAGYYLDGVLFDTNIKEVARSAQLPGKRRFYLLRLDSKTQANYIAGFKNACSGLKEGAKFELLVPSGKAYGEEGKGAIGPWEPLRFEMEIIRVD